MKFDNAGMGFDHGKEFTDNWWENVYNQAVSNIEVSFKTKQFIIISLPHKFFARM